MAQDIKYIEQTTPQELDVINERAAELRAAGHLVQVEWDTETTGFINVEKGTGKNANRMTEFGCKILVDGVPLMDKFNKDISSVQVYFNPWLKNPKLYQNSQAYAVHGIDKEFLEGKKTLGGNTNIMLQEPAKDIEEHIDGIAALLSENVLVSHNGKTFDVPFFNHELKHCDRDFLPKLLIHLDTQWYFQREIKKVNERFPDLAAELDWSFSAKLTVDNEPNKGVVPFLEKLTGETCDIARDKHGALLDSEILDWVGKKMYEAKLPDGTKAFPEYAKAYKVIKEQIEKNLKKTEDEKDRDLSELPTGIEIDTRFYSNKTSIYAENPFYVGSADIDEIFEKASNLGIKSLTIMDHIRPNQNPIVRDVAKKYPDIQANYGTTVRLKVGEEFILANVLVKNGEDYADLMDLTYMATKNDFEEPYITLEDLSGRSISKTIDAPYVEKTPHITEAHNNLDELRIKAPISKETADRLLEAGFIFDIESSEDIRVIESLGVPMDKTTLKSNVFYVDDVKKHELRIQSVMGVNGSKNIDISDFVNNKQLKTQAEAYAEIVGQDSEDAVRAKVVQSQKIERDFVLPEHRDIMADYFVEDGYENSFDEFIKKSNAGLEERLVENGITDEAEIQSYWDRLKMEQDVIAQMLETSKLKKEKGETFDLIKFDEYLLGMSNKIASVKAVNDIIETLRLDGIYSDKEAQKSTILVDNHIRKLLVGTARGSAAGSLIAYTLKITEIDPMPYGLLFERFLNPERVSVPDIDTDFKGQIYVEDLKNPKIEEKFPHLYEYMKYRVKTRYEGEEILEIKQFVSEYYEWYRNTNNGKKPFNPEEEKTGGVLTLGFYKSKTAFADMAKVYGDDYASLMGFSSSVGLGDYLKSFVGASVAETELSIKSIMEGSEELTHVYNNNPLIRSLLNDAMLIERTVKSEGIHAGAVVSEPSQIDGVKTTTIIYNKQGVPVCPFTMKNVEVMKDDILGLATLETIDDTIQLVMEGESLTKEEYREFSAKVRGLTSKKFDIVQEELDRCVDILVRGQNKGLFQIESDGMIDLFKQVIKVARDRGEIKTYTDLFKVVSVLIALYRPGPMDSGMLDRYISNVNGTTEIEIPLGDPELEKLLSETSGVVAYQEQVMKMVQIVGGFSLGEADIIRRAMGKKDIKLMNEYQAKFVEGGLKQGHKEDELNEMFENIKKFAGYGFNKSHSAAYAEIALETLFLKANYPTYFAASTLNNKITKKIEEFKPVLNQVILEGNKVNTPDVFDYENYSIKFGIRKEEDGSESINYGFEFIVGLSSAVKIYNIINKMDINSPLSKEEFREVLFSELDKSAVEKLIKAGTLRIGDESLSDVNEQYYTFKDKAKKGEAKKSQYDHVKEFLMKDKVAFAKGFQNVFSKIYGTWKKSSLHALVEDEEIRANMERLGLAKKFDEAMNGTEDEPGMLEKIKTFPETDFEIWLTETGTIGMENTVEHPLKSGALAKKEKEGKLVHLDDLLKAVDEKIAECQQLGTSAEDEVNQILKKNDLDGGLIGVCSGLGRIKSKKEKDMLIGDIVSENNRRITILVTGDSYDDIKMGEDIKNNEIVHITGEVNFSEQYGLGIFVKGSEIVRFNEADNGQDENIKRAELNTKTRHRKPKTSDQVDEVEQISGSVEKVQVNTDVVNKDLFMDHVKIGKVSEIADGENPDIDYVFILKGYETGKTKKDKPMIKLELSDGEDTVVVNHYTGYDKKSLEEGIDLPIKLKISKKGNFYSTAFRSQLIFVGKAGLKSEVKELVDERVSIETDVSKYYTVIPQQEKDKSIIEVNTGLFGDKIVTENGEVKLGRNKLYGRNKNALYSNGSKQLFAIEQSLKEIINEIIEEAERAAIPDDTAKKVEAAVVEPERRQITSFVIKNDKDEELTYQIKDGNLYELKKGVGANTSLVISEETMFEEGERLTQVVITGVPSIDRYNLNIVKDLVSYSTTRELSEFSIQANDGGKLRFKKDGESFRYITDCERFSIVVEDEFKNDILVRGERSFEGVEVGVSGKQPIRRDILIVEISPQYEVSQSRSVSQKDSSSKNKNIK